MNQRSNILVKLWRKLRPIKPEPVRLRSVPEPKERLAPRGLSIEPLEGRIAPAALLNPTTVSYHDSDGDLVTIKFSKAILPTTLSDAQLSTVFKFSAGDGAWGTDADVNQQLQLIDLSATPGINGKNPAAGVSMTISVEQIGAGDGRANIGAIKGGQLALGSISIEGDLGQIDCGNAKDKVGLKSLSVYSLGAASDSQIGIATYESTIIGTLGSLNVTTNIHEAYVHVINGVAITGPVIVHGDIGKITIGGSLEGRALVDGTSENTGTILAAGNIGSVKIGTTASDGLKGGGGKNSGSIVANGNIRDITVSGSLTGKDGLGSGGISANGNIGKASIGTAISPVASGVADGLIGGIGKNSGSITALGDIGNVTVNGHLGGGQGVSSGGITVTKNLGTVNIFGSIDGGKGTSSGVVSAGGNLGAVTVTGHVMGGDGQSSGGVNATGSLKSFTLGDSAQAGGGAGGFVSAGVGDSTGVIFSGKEMGAVKISGSLLGVNGLRSGGILATGNLASVTLGGGIVGGSKLGSGFIKSGGNIGNVTIGSLVESSIKGGSADETGLISSAGAIGTVKVSGSILGGDFIVPVPAEGSTDTVVITPAIRGYNSGGIFASGNLANVTIEKNITGGTKLFSGFIDGLNVGTAKIGGDVIGGAGDHSGSLVSQEAFQNVSIAGDLKGSTGAFSGSIFSSAGPGAAHDLGSVTIGKSMIGGGGDNSGMISAGGKLIKAAIGTPGSVMAAMQGGGGSFSGGIFAGSSIVSAVINGDVQGGGGANSASIQTGVSLTKLSITGALKGGAGALSGSLVSYDAFDKTGDMGAVSISGGIAGGIGRDSGSIEAEGFIKSVTLGSIKGDDGAYSGSVLSGAGVFHSGSIGAVNVSGSVTGGTGAHSGTIEANGNLAAVKIAMNLDKSAIRAADAIGSITVSGTVDHSTVSARGQVVQAKSADIAIAAFNAGSVSNSQILAGYDMSGLAVNPDAQIGAIKVSGTWTASNAVAGIANAAGNFGSSTDIKIAGTDNTAIISRIASITIGGAISGSDSSLDDHFGFVAEEILAFKNGSNSVALTKNTIDPAKELDPARHDVSVRELAPAVS